MTHIRSAHKVSQVIVYRNLSITRKEQLDPLHGWCHHESGPWSLEVFPNVLRLIFSFYNPKLIVLPRTQCHFIYLKDCKVSQISVLSQPFILDMRTLRLSNVCVLPRNIHLLRCTLQTMNLFLTHLTNHCPLRFSSSPMSVFYAFYLLFFVNKFSLKKCIQI